MVEIPRLKKNQVMLLAGAIVMVVLGVACAMTVFKIKKLNSEVTVGQGEIEKLRKENVDGKASYDKIKNDAAKLEQNLQQLTAERDKLAAQVKELSPEKPRADAFEKRTKDLEAQVEALAKKRQEAVDENLALKGMVNDLQITQKQLLKEKEDLTQTLSFERDKTNIKRALDENVSLKKEAVQLKDERENLRKEIARLKKENDDTDRLYQEAEDRSRAFADQAQDVPGKFTDLARQNRALVKETATTHYNMGVYYMKHKEFSRARGEFERAIALNPKDAYSHFNLGYIFAEHLVDRPQAIIQFKEFLRYTKKGDKDADWAKKYIVTWETWDNKRPME